MAPSPAAWEPAQDPAPLTEQGQGFLHPPDSFAALEVIRCASATLSSQLKALKLGRMLDTMDVRLAQARDDQLGYLEFLQLLLQDEIERRKIQSDYHPNSAR